MTRIGITSLNSILGAPGLAVAKCLKMADENLDLIGLDYTPSSPGVFDPIFSKVRALPPSLTYEYIRALKLIAEEENLDVLIPNTDPEVVVISRYLEELRDSVKLLIPSYSVVEKVKDKVSAERYMREKKIKTPKSYIVDLKSQKLDIDLGYPVLVKSEEGVFSCINKEELRICLKRLRIFGFKNALVQEYVEGDEYSIASVAIDGEIRGWVMQKKLALSDFGSTLMGVTVNNERVLRIAEDVIRGLRWTGPLEIEFRSAGEELFLTDFNLRFPAWIYLSPFAGVNLPYLLLRLIYDNSVKAAMQKVGVIILRTIEDKIIDFRKLGELIMEFSSPKLFLSHKKKSSS
ncbi:ATP-grasp domain-containing protein [Candidatus Methanodesulfokora washburnensis]|jgi:predicted ATP-grasp superfamily ATP-dependent carboligase|uniref:ATP-grasp domain-containing protein n=1 Tax=Candidatus Methanodesulfokora washburnensis TaxID=2478471 RepID=A0A3R9Q0K6_9CREN|nr:ATP-grasp domain-containing protein [Candidatus Methanodesulfokores washburnensis]RSN78091.1 ATP-grasp domain-containing protein [Candidatus Methanodesulfokores washburnensis]